MAFDCEGSCFLCCSSVSLPPYLPCASSSVSESCRPDSHSRSSARWNQCCLQFAIVREYVFRRSCSGRAERKSSATQIIVWSAKQIAVACDCECVCVCARCRPPLFALKVVAPQHSHSQCAWLYSRNPRNHNISFVVPYAIAPSVCVQARVCASKKMGSWYRTNIAHCVHSWSTARS